MLAVKITTKRKHHCSSAFQTSLYLKKNKIEIRVFCKTKEKKPTLLENKPGKIKEN
jgi:hypothetical protein